MKCASCGGSTQVVNSVPGDYVGDKRGYLITKAQAVYGWWSPQDFRLRERVCKSCSERAQTIEVPLLDLSDAFDDLRLKGATFNAVVQAANRRALGRRKEVT